MAAVTLSILDHYVVGGSRYFKTSIINIKLACWDVTLNLFLIWDLYGYGIFIKRMGFMSFRVVDLDSKSDQPAGEQCTVNHRKFRKLRQRLPSIATTLVVIAATTAITVAGDSPALAASPPRPVIHFIRISTHGGPQWAATAKLYNPKTQKTIENWVTGNVVWRSGGYQRWRHAEDSALKVDIRLESREVNTETSPLDKKGLTWDRDYCFLVKAFGKVEYTGDSKTGNCKD